MIEIKIKNFKSNDMIQTKKIFKIFGLRTLCTKGLSITEYIYIYIYSLF